MNYKPLYPLSEAISEIITTDNLQEEMGVKAIVDLVKFKAYLEKTGRLAVLEALDNEETGFFCINEDDIYNDHILVGLKSNLIENENHTAIFLLPSVRTFKNETEEFISELKELLLLDSDKEKFYNSVQVCIIKCEMMQQLIKMRIDKEKLN